MRNVFVWFLFVATLPAFSIAQDGASSNSELFPNFSLGGFAGTSDEPAQWDASYEIDPLTSSGILEIEVTLSPGWYIYSVTQPSGGPIKTQFSISSPSNIELTGTFAPSTEPNRSVSKVFSGVTVEKHEQSVVWSAPIRVPSGFKDAITVSVDAQVCNKVDGACVPVNEKVTATYLGELTSSAAYRMEPTSKESSISQKAANTEPFQDGDYSVQWTASLSKAVAQPGEQLTLQFMAKPGEEYHVYESATDDADFSTNFVVAKKSGLWVTAPEADSDAGPSKLIPTIRYHTGDVTWSIPIIVPPTMKPGDYPVEGAIAYQACTDTSCLQPKALAFSTSIRVVGTADDVSGGSRLVRMQSTRRADVMDSAAETKWVDDESTIREAIEKAAAEKTTQIEKETANTSEANPISEMAEMTDLPRNENKEESDERVAALPHDILDSNKALAGSDLNVEKKSSSFPVILSLAFVGGVILNFMPCVLPVVGLKVMSFVQQAGEDRGRVFMLNLVYAAGIMVVFALLTVLAVTASFSWGEQFTYFPVRLGLTVLMFAMALSYLGVWEIPVPGMAAGGASQSLQQREGYTGAFFKGVFATILATPCSGPLLGWILGLTIAFSALQTTAVIMTVGLGMALPYLLIGVWPALVAWLPKPGDWMETLKELLAFLFLGTVAFFFHQFADGDKLAVFVTLIGVWFGCWVIGKVPNWADTEKRLMAWGSGIAAATVIGWMAFTYLDNESGPQPGEKTIAWIPYSEEKLDELLADGKTVMVDFTAKWCVNCIVNYKVALNTEATREKLDELNAVPMLADWTDRDPEIKSKLEELQSRSIPLLAIYPGSRPQEPIVLRDLVTQSSVLDALEKAGHSQDGSMISNLQSRSTAAPIHSSVSVR